MTWRPTRPKRHVSTDLGRSTRSRARGAILVFVLFVLMAGPAFATNSRTPSEDPPMPDPCKPAPMLPFCR